MNRTRGQVPDAILFDLDNTLCTYIDAKMAACRAVVEYLKQGNEQDLFQYFLRSVHSFEDTKHVHDYMTDLGVYTPGSASHASHLFEEVKLKHILPYPGVHTTLRQLADQGIKMAVVTDASGLYARKRLEKCEIDNYFPVVITPDKSKKPKPDHTPFLEALSELQVSGTIWLVGDSVRREIVPGNELGFITVHARYGDYFSGNNPDITPHYTIDRFYDLLELEGLKK